MSKSSARRPGVIDTEPRLNGLFWKFNAVDLIWAISLGLVLYMVFIAMDVPVPLIFALAIVAATLYRFPEGGRMPPGRVYMAVFDSICNLWIRYVRRGKYWRPSKKQPHFPGLVEDLIAIDLEEREEPIGLIRPDKGSGLAVLIIGDGWAPAARDSEEQVASLKGVARKQRVLGSDVGLSSVLHSRDSNPWPVRDFQDEALQPFVFKPPFDHEVDDPMKPHITKELQRRSRFLHNVITSGARNRDHVRNPIAAEVVYIRGNDDLIRQATSTKRRKKKGKQDETEPFDHRRFSRSPIVRAARLSAQQWAASGLRNARIASHKQTVEFLRATSAHTLAEFYDEEHAGLTVKDSYMGYLPQFEVTVKKEFIKVDNAYVAILKATAQAAEVTPTTYRKVRSVLDDKGLPMSMTFAKVGVNVSVWLEQSWLNRWLALQDTITEAFMASGRRSTSYRLRKQEEEEREESLGKGGKHTHDYMVIAAVFTPDVMTMEDSLACLHDAFVEAGLEPYNIEGERQILRAWKSLIGVNRM